MFNSLRGALTYKGTDRINLANGGIEWNIYTSGKSVERLPEIGEEVKVYTYLHHREDQMTLFGFANIEERTVFLDLIKVEGLGPKLALKILSGIDVEEFIRALEADDIDLLSSVPGLGKKTAQKILLKMKGKLSMVGSPHEVLENDIVAALAGMGFDKKFSRDTVKSAIRELDLGTFSEEERERELLKRSIELMSRKEYTK